MLIRRPECLGPALRGEGEGLLRAIIDANKMSERIADRRKVHDEAEGTQFEHPLPESDEDEDYIDTGAAILNFYCTLVDLLGRCAPDSSVIEQGKRICQSLFPGLRCHLCKYLYSTTTLFIAKILRQLASFSFIFLSIYSLIHLVLLHPL